MNQLDFQEEITQFADVILPVPVPRLFTYRIPREYAGQIQPGARVIVQFGKTKVLTALVARIHPNPPKQYQAKYILEVLDDTPLVTRWQLELFNWISEYYLCHIGEVMNVALPSGLKISSQSKVQFNPDFEHPDLLTPREAEIVEEIKKQQSLTYDELARFADIKNVYHLIKSLIGKRAVIVFEEVKEKYTPKIIRKLRLTSFYTDTGNLTELIRQLEKTPRQQEVLLEYLRHVPALRSPELNAHGISKSVFSKNEELSDSSLETLIKKGIFETFDIVVSRFAEDTGVVAPPPVLSEAQQQALAAIAQAFEEKDTVLFHGVTGSGKTEVYIHLIEQVLASGSQVLYLVPEIALTTQIVVRLKKIFGEKVGIYHSRFSDNERVEVWKGVLSGRFQFVIGVRSSVFLPFDNLGLIIVDEEHEPSYKQYDPAPRYHARDTALVIARMQGARVLLGSATPSVESYFHATQGRYGLVTLSERFGNASLPAIELLDIRQARRNRGMRGEFSLELLQELGTTLEKKEQTILFQNRRGYSPYITCEDCGWIAKCDSCDVSLTYHQREAELRCHYCGHKEPVPRTCPACGSTKVKTIGFGTEKLEEDLQLHFPAARIQRMDLDTTRSKTAFQQMIQDFERGDTDMLVGTQMVSKGLDFDRVSLVAIFDADRMIHFPDFRASERAFQLLTQVAGRAGRRKDRAGRVVIQTNDTQHPLLAKVIHNDYEGFFTEELEERRSFFYPPFTRIIRLTTRHIEQQVAQAASARLAALLTAQLGTDRIKGPETPLVERIRNQFLFDVLLKFERNLNLRAVKEKIREVVEEIITTKDFKGVSIVTDVDPV